MADKPEHLLTTALPYANGDLHLGHALEYVQADVYARALKRLGEKLVFLGAEDTHGTPIQIRAEREGKTPEDLISYYAERHREDLARLGVTYDYYYTTHSEENRILAQYIYQHARENGYIIIRKIEHLYCEHDTRFLPDRYVRGTCPYCGAEDQYGDQCEVCGRTYKPTDLKDPRCALCGSTPVLRETEHAFFQLPKLKDWLRGYLHEHPFQPEVIHYLENWLNDLREWDITRDEPYFGIPIPDLPGKYFYVWLDAPIGYLATLWKHAKEHGLATADPESLRQLWNELRVREHIIGKDIIYFHYLFWPALLHAAGFKPPNRMYTHGHITLKGGKMSKSRGTFLRVRDFPWPADYLRYYYARQSSEKLTDIDYDDERLLTMINRELIDKLLNMHYRVLTLAKRKRLEGDVRINPVLFTSIADEYAAYAKAVRKHNLKDAVESLLHMAEAVNSFIQHERVWEQGREEALREAYTAALLTLPALEPVTPFAAEQLLQQYGMSEKTLQLLWQALIRKQPELLSHLTITPREVRIIYKRETPRKKEEEETAAGEVHPVEQLDLRAARITHVEDHPNADKLYILTLDLGSEARRIVSGIKHAYTPADLVGKMIILLANLKPARIRGVESQGMLLAAEHPATKRIVLLTVDAQPGTRVRPEGARHDAAPEVTIRTLEKAGLTVGEEGIILTPLGRLVTPDGKPVQAPGAASDWKIR